MIAGSLCWPDYCFRNCVPRSASRVPVRAESEAGYALVETLVAAAVVVGLAAGVAQVALLTGAAVRESGAQGRALFLAVQKIEQLQSLLWTLDDRLEPVSDEATNLALDPPAPGGQGLQPSGPLTGPGGDVDYLDRDGRWVGSGRPAAARHGVRAPLVGDTGRRAGRRCAAAAGAGGRHGGAGIRRDARPPAERSGRHLARQRAGPALRLPQSC